MTNLTRCTLAFALTLSSGFSLAGDFCCVCADTSGLISVRADSNDAAIEICQDKCRGNSRGTLIGNGCQSAQPLRSKPYSIELFTTDNCTGPGVGLGPHPQESLAAIGLANMKSLRLIKGAVTVHGGSSYSAPFRYLTDATSSQAECVTPMWGMSIESIGTVSFSR